MKDLFEKEEQVLRHARALLGETERLPENAAREEFAALANEYAQMLRQLRWVTRIADLTALGLNTDKTLLLSKVNIDALTGIYNRRFLMANLSQFIQELEASHGWLTVMMLDVDYFKNFNDTYGHPVGDVCLRKVANALHTALSGADDFVVRYGGEEFIAVLPGADDKVGMYVARRIQNGIYALNIPHRNSDVADRVTLSIGVVSAIPRPQSGMQAFIDRADAALYLSKQHGRDRVTYLSFEEEKK